MGYSISWLAVKDKEPQLLLQELGLAPTGKKVIAGNLLYTGGILPNGWFIVVINRYDHKWVSAKSLASLSDNCEIVVCTIEEHVMACSAELWLNGSPVWEIKHDSQKDNLHLETSGHLPDSYAAIEKQYFEKQKQGDLEKWRTDYIFEIPLQTAKSIVGFKHDEANAGSDDFEEFIETVTNPWWRF